MKKEFKPSADTVKNAVTYVSWLLDVKRPKAYTWGVEQPHADVLTLDTEDELYYVDAYELLLRKLEPAGANLSRYVISKMCSQGALLCDDEDTAVFKTAHGYVVLDVTDYDTCAIHLLNAS